MTNKEAIANLNHLYGMVSPDIQRSLDVAIKALEERPQGEWLKFGVVGLKACYKCSICGHYAVDHIENNVTETYPYCHCGAKMGGGVE